MGIATTRMSSRGQVVIPEEIRESLGLSEGSRFVVVGQGDSVILKTISPPSLEHFRDLLENARKSAKKAGLKKGDVTRAIKMVRKR